MESHVLAVAVHVRPALHAQSPHPVECSWSDPCRCLRSYRILWIHGAFLENVPGVCVCLSLCRQTSPNAAVLRQGLLILCQVLCQRVPSPGQGKCVLLQDLVHTRDNEKYSFPQVRKVCGFPKRDFSPIGQPILSNSCVIQVIYNYRNRRPVPISMVPKGHSYKFCTANYYHSTNSLYQGTKV
jgi:hypothetical protein